MHIAFVTPEYVTEESKSGGLATYVKKVGKQLAERGHHISIFYWSDRNKQWDDSGAKVYGVKRTRLPRQLRIIPQSRAFWFLLERIITGQRIKRSIFKVHHKNPIDVLQTSNFEAPAYLMRKNNRIPLVCRISSYRPLWSSSSRHPRTFSKYLGEWLELRQVLDADGLFVPSFFLARVFDRFVGVKPEVIRTPFEKLSESSWDYTFWKDNFKNKRYLLYFGNLNRGKGVDLIAEISSSLLARHHDLHLSFIGSNSRYDDNRTMVEYILEQADAYRDRILYYSAVDKEALFPVVSNAVGVLLPSRVNNYPNACLEAQYMGIPVIGAHSSSLEEMITDGKTGFLIENGDRNSLKLAIEQLLSLTTIERKKMVQNIRECVTDREDKDFLSQLERYYQKVIFDFTNKV